MNLDIKHKSFDYIKDMQNKNIDNLTRFHLCDIYEDGYKQSLKDSEDKDRFIHGVTEVINIPPMIRPKLNTSDIILIKNALEICKKDLIPELQERCDFIIKELLKAEIKIK